MKLDPSILARIQFAFTVSFHIIFPTMSIGLASFLAVVEFLWLKTKKPVYLQMFRQQCLPSCSASLVSIWSRSNQASARSGLHMEPLSLAS